MIETNAAEEVKSSAFDNWGNQLSSTTDGYIPGTSRGWSIIGFSSQELKGEDGRAVNAIDGNTSTWWHTVYKSGEGSRYSSPHHIIIAFGSVVSVS